MDIRTVSEGEDYGGDQAKRPEIRTDKIASRYNNNFGGLCESHPGIFGLCPRPTSINR